jgi:carboxyl-terminal processing protease
VVLVDRGTLGAAEIVAAAVLDNSRGDVVGERSYGAGGDQQLFPLRDGGGLLITTIKYASPKGVPFMGTTVATSGVMPNVEVRRPDQSELPSLQSLEEEGVRQPEEPQPSTPPVTEDLPLKKALEILQHQKSQ